LKRNEEEEGEVAEAEKHKGGEQCAVVTECFTRVEGAVFFVPQSNPHTLAIDIDIPSSILQDIKHPSISHSVKHPSEAFFTIPSAAASSSTLSISAVSDLTPTELGEETEEREERMTTRHDTFYFEDGNVEIVCGGTAFRVHSTIVSFSSPKLRDVLSPSALLNASMPEGCPRIAFNDGVEDFAVLLKMIYTPGCVPPPHDVGSVNGQVDRPTDSHQGTGFRNLQHLHRSFGW